MHWLSFLHKNTSQHIICSFIGHHNTSLASLEDITTHPWLRKMPSQHDLDPTGDNRHMFLAPLKKITSQHMLGFLKEDQHMSLTSLEEIRKQS
jgi:hypothetical protein